MEGEPKQEPNEVPFVGDLVNSVVSELETHKKSSKLSEIEDNPNKIIRTESFYGLNKRFKDKIEIIELVRIAKKLYGELEAKYDIPVPADFLIGKDKKGEEVVYSVVDKIDGKNLNDVESSDEVVTQVQDLYASIARYFLNKSKEEGSYLVDINGPSQYVYGKKPGEQTNKIYLIDTDFYILNSDAGIYLVVEWLTRHMAGVETHFNIKLEKARKNIEKLVDQPLSENISDSEKEKVNKSIVGIRKFLNEESLDSLSGPAIPPF